MCARTHFQCARFKGVRCILSKCNCQELPEAVYCDESLSAFDQYMSMIDTGNWIELFKCGNCTQLWAIDASDKYQERVASKVDQKTNWHKATDDQRKTLLLNARGGITKNECMMAGCNGYAVTGVVFCIDHLYETGARK